MEISGHILHAARTLTQLRFLEGDKKLVINLMLSVFLSALNVFFLLTLSLLYLAKSCLHWLRKCVMSPACLRTAELKLIKVW